MQNGQLANPVPKQNYTKSAIGKQGIDLAGGSRQPKSQPRFSQANLLYSRHDITTLEEEPKMRLAHLVCFILITAMGVPVRAQNHQWVEETLSSMTLEEKVGQLFMAELVGLYGHNDSPHLRLARELVQKYHIGSFILAGGTVIDIAMTANMLQREAKIPLLINGDLEAGLSVSHPWWRSRGWTKRLPHYVSGGGTAFPSQMAIGATGNPQYAYEMGRITAVESRAIGIHWTNSPVADVNNNPDNPIINTRSYGENPAIVGAMVEAYVRGLQEARMIATLKHFPGHGDTGEDSHMGLPLLPFDRARLDSVELVPFRRGIAAGAKAVMTAHLSLPRIDGGNRPATLSRPILTDLLRHSLGFDGIIITDGMQMQGITDHFGTGESAVLALEAGADCILAPLDIPEAYNAVLQAVKSGRLSTVRIDTSVRRILEAKSWVGLDRKRFVVIDSVQTVVGAPENQRMAEKIADASVTLLRNDGPVIPLPPQSRVTLLAVSEEPFADAGKELQAVLQDLGRTVSVVRVTNETGSERIRKIQSELGNADVILVGVYMTIGAWKGQSSISGPVQQLLTSLATTGKPVITVAFGDPYVLGKVPATRGMLTPYFGSVLAERSVARALAGIIDIQGHLPVTIPGRFRIGDGLTLPATTRRLPREQ
jgi:beta-N-acetylhexosaminidase